MARKTVKKISIDAGGIFLPLLALLFIALKLTHYIGWSWWWVLAPLWIPAVFAIGVLLGILFVKFLFNLFK